MKIPPIDEGSLVNYIPPEKIPMIRDGVVGKIDLPTNQLIEGGYVDSGPAKFPITIVNPGDVGNTGVGGGGGGAPTEVVTVGGVVVNPYDGNLIPIIEEPIAAGTINANYQYIFNISSNVKGASIYLDGENTFKTTPNIVKLTLTEITSKNVKTVTVEKQGYQTKELYEIGLVANPDFDNVSFRAISENQNKDFTFDRFGNQINIDASNRLQLTSVPPFIPSVTYFEDKDGRGVVVSMDDSLDKTLEFKKLSPITIEDIVSEEPPQTTALIKIRLDGEEGSARIIVNDKLIELKRGFNNFTFDLGSAIQLISSDTSNYRLTSIKLNRGTQTDNVISQNSLESVSTKFNLQENTSGIVVTEKVIVSNITKPIISFIKESELSKYNKNENSALPIGLNTSNVNKITAYIKDKKFTFDKLDINSKSQIITIPASVFDTIGQYKIILVPSDSNGDGDSIETFTNVVAESYVGVPDITYINYPKLVRGADYAGTNVNFEISYQSVNTDYVMIGKVGTEFSTKSPANGKVNLNFAELLKIGGSEVSQNDDLISITLTLTPYNDSGYEKLEGKKELINIQFDKGDLTIPRDSAINRISDLFLSQIDDSCFEKDTSKYLTHLLHLGDGDNKVITTWTGSEGSLILKLYEPLPTSVQPNDQVWISKLQSNPIVDTININSDDTHYCPPLKGPNFSLEPDNGIGYKVFDDLTASGSLSSVELINRYALEQGIDTSQLNIQYVSGSEYIFENFSNFGSIEERVNNFFYKIQLLEKYQSKYEELTAETLNGDGLLAEAVSTHETYLTLDGYQIITEDGVFDIQWEQFVYRSPNEGIEAQKVLNGINEILKGWDGFETWLYKSTNELAYPKISTTTPNGLTTYVLKGSTNVDVIAWYESLVSLASAYDKDNPNYLVNNIPEFVREDYNNQDFITFLDMIGNHFDIVWSYVNGLKKTKISDERSDVGVSNKLVWHLLKSFGWDGKRAYDSQFLWEYAFGTDKEGFQKTRISLEQANNEVWRRIANNLPYLLKHKGTSRAMKAMLACYGVPSSLLTIMEFGGPQDPTKGGTTKFTFDDRTAAIHLQQTSKVIVPWKGIAGEYPTTIEFAFKPDSLPSTSYTLISASQWTLSLQRTTGSFGKLELNFGGDLAESGYVSEPFVSASVSTYYFNPSNDYPYSYGPDLLSGSIDFPISTENYSNVCINRTDYGGASSLYEVWLATANGDRIITSVSMSIFTDDNQWLSGSQIGFGGDGFVGNLDEFRLWRTPLQRSKFEIHTLQPDSIAGNSYSSSTEDLLFRLDFERPKDRTKSENVGILNVAINQTYGEAYASASNFYSASSYPYQYTPYERTVTATVPSTGMTLSNKIRFEEQTLVSNLSHRTRATEKSLDRAPVDSSRLGLFFSPIKELNMDIIKSFGDFNIDNYIGDPSDEYRDSYKQLEGLRTYYFERLDRDINEYIQLVRYINKSLFDTLADLAPARAKISKGLLIEPHYLERSKTRWDKPVSHRNDFETSINITEDRILTSTYNTFNTTLNVDDATELTSELRSFETVIDENEGIQLVATAPFYDGLIDYNTDGLLEGSYPTYTAEITAPNGASLTGQAESFKFEVIGMEGDSLSNLGFGLYAERGVGIWKRYDIFGNVTQSRQNMYVVKEQYSEKVSTQTAGYPVNGASPGEQVKYEDVLVTKNKFRISLMPYSGSITVGNEVVEVTPINGYLPTHYKFKNNLSEGLKLSYFKGSKQTAATTPDGLSPVETFTTNPNILRVAKTGRGSGEPILEVD